MTKALAHNSVPIQPHNSSFILRKESDMDPFDRKVLSATQSSILKWIFLWSFSNLQWTPNVLNEKKHLCKLYFLTDSMRQHQKYTDKQKDAEEYKMAWISQILKGNKSLGTKGTFVISL